MEELATAVPLAERVGTTGWQEVLLLCTTLDRSACALTWCFFNALDVSKVQGNSSFWATIFTSGMELRAARTRAAFPISEGDFLSTEREFVSRSLQDSVTEDFVRLWAEKAWAVLACFACNVLWHGPRPFPTGPWNKQEKLLVKAVGASIVRMRSHGQAECNDFASLDKELRSRRVDYTGDEVGVCHKLTFEQVLPALPPKEHGGAVRVVDFVSESTRSFLENPDKLVKADVGQELPRLQGRVHMEKGDVEKIADELVDRGVCSWIPLSEVATYRGQRVRNGLFGVPKSGLVDGSKPILRLIMNLVPSNSILHQFQGATKNLPHITAWLSTYIEDGEELRIWQSDMASAFYLFRLPEVWYKYLSFNVTRRMHGDESSGEDGLYSLACNVLPMGWGSSVSIMQELSEKLLDIPSIPKESQIVRGKPLPVWMVGLLRDSAASNRCWWHIYLDNYASAQVAVSGSSFEEGDALHAEAESAWERANVISSAKKRKAKELTGEELGAFIAGDERTIGPSADRMLKLVQSTVWLLARPRLSRRLVQVVAGRWVHVFQYRRPAMSFLEAIWEYTASSGIRMELRVKVRRELFACLAALPFIHTFLGAKVSECTTASDASHWGGAVGVARELQSSGEDFVRHSLATPQVRPSGCLVISLFNGVGGSFRAYDILGIKPLGLVAFDTHGPANRVTSRRWPSAELHGDVRSLDAALIDQWLLKFVGLQEIHVWGGFPCVDLSSVKKGGKGLQGPQSSLFYELPRILKLLRKRVPRHVKIKFVAENVASMAKTECDKISQEMEVHPYHFNCVHAVPMQRPRLCWTSETLEDCLDGLSFVEQEHWIEVIAEAPYPVAEDWIEEGYTWPGGEEGYTLPTALKSIVRSRPPPAPAGLARCDEDCLARYQADQFRFPPYHYLPRFLFWKNDKWRLANSSEKELLLGYGYGHTSLCYSASKIKQSKVKYEDERLSLLGDSFSVYSFVIAAAGATLLFQRSGSMELALLKGRWSSTKDSSRLERAIHAGGSPEGKEATQQLQRNNSAPALVVKDLPRHPRIAWQEDRGLDSTPELKETPKEKPKTHGFVPVWGPQAGLEKLTPPKVVQHHIQGGSAEGDAPGMHGHCKDQDVQDGLERGIGNGRRYIGTQSHFVQNAVTASDGPTTHGNVKDLASHLGRQRRTVQVPSQIFAGVGDAGDDIPFGEMGWLGAGRRHYAVKENIVGGVSEDQVTPTRRVPRQQRDHVHGGSGTDTPPESEVRYGRPREAAFQEGLERYIGHGRRHCPEWRQQDQIFRPEPEAVESPAHVRPVGGADHIVRTHGQATCAEDTPSEQGKRHFGARDRIGFGCSVLPSDGKEDYVQGLPRGIGQGKQRIFEKDHLMGVFRRTEDNPGSHGHSRDDDFQDGLERGIGHGKPGSQGLGGIGGIGGGKSFELSTCIHCALLLKRLHLSILNGQKRQNWLFKMATTDAQLPFMPQGKVQSSKKDKSPKKVLLKMSEAVLQSGPFSFKPRILAAKLGRYRTDGWVDGWTDRWMDGWMDGSLDMPAYVGRGLEPIQEDMEHFAVISPPPGLDKRDDEFSDSLWSAVGAPIWACLARVVQPRQLLAVAMLLQVPFLTTMLCVHHPNVSLAAAVVFLQSMTSSGSLIFVSFNFMMSIKADVSHAAYRMGILEMTRQAVTWFITAYIFLASPSSKAGTAEEPLPPAVYWLLLPTAAATWQLGYDTTMQFQWNNSNFQWDLTVDSHH
eukprot:s503_g33.t1